MRGMITEIHRAAFNDGPGVRTAVFFKGCPLRCLWCHNPETQNPEPELMGESICGKSVTVEEIMSTVRLDAGHYTATGGGLTVTGGEPLAQPEFCLELLKQARTEGFHTCIETSGMGSLETLRMLIPLTDLWLFDIKGLSADYERLTGAPFALAEQSLRFLLSRQASVLLRCPIVPGIHNNERYDSWLEQLSLCYPGVIGVERLPFNRLGMDKYEALGRLVPSVFMY